MVRLPVTRQWMDFSLLRLATTSDFSEGHTSHCFVVYCKLKAILITFHCNSIFDLIMKEELAEVHKWRSRSGRPDSILLFHLFSLM